MTYSDLQNGLYNLMMQGLGFAPGSPFQMVQPSTPLPASTSNNTLWAYMNNLPPFSLTQNYIQSAGNQFFSDYAALMSALQPSVTIDVKADVGADVYAQFVAYVLGLPAPVAVTQLPNLFLNWAFLQYPSVAIKGASDLSAQLLDPIYRAQLALMPYTAAPDPNNPGQTIPGKAPEWSLGYSQLVSQLNAAPNKSFSSQSVQSSGNVTSSWTQGGDSGFFGLWGSSSSSSSQSATFASQAVSLSVAFQHVTTYTPVPGHWYDSAAFGLAYATQSGKPWNPGSSITWQKTFGPNGNMRYIASSLVVVSGMNIKAVSSSSFSHADQTTINQSSGGGLWPFYSTGSSSSFTTSHSFSNSGQLTINSSSHAGIPIVVGVNVLSAAQYTGHASAGHLLFNNLVAKLALADVARVAG
jgi:hypothetical protein